MTLDWVRSAPANSNGLPERSDIKDANSPSAVMSSGQRINNFLRASDYPSNDNNVVVVPGALPTSTTTTTATSNPSVSANNVSTTSTAVVGGGASTTTTTGATATVPVANHQYPTNIQSSNTSPPLSIPPASLGLPPTSQPPPLPIPSLQHQQQPPPQQVQQPHQQQLLHQHPQTPQQTSSSGIATVTAGLSHQIHSQNPLAHSHSQQHLTQDQQVQPAGVVTVPTTSSTQQSLQIHPQSSQVTVPQTQPQTISTQPPQPPPLQPAQHSELQPQEQTVNSGTGGGILSTTNSLQLSPPQPNGLSRNGISLQPPPLNPSSSPTSAALGTPSALAGTSGLGGPNGLGGPGGLAGLGSAGLGLHSLGGNLGQPTPTQGRQTPNSAYPNVNSMPTLHTVAQPNMLHGLQTMSTFGSGWESSFGYPGMPSMHSLMQNPRIDGIGHSAHHTSTIPTASPLGPSLAAPGLGANPHFANVGMLSGGITKPRKHRRRNELTLKGEDAHSLLMGLPTARYDPSILLAPTAPATNLPEADGVQFKYLHQLPEAKVRRLRDEKIKPIEELTFDDIKAYNRNQLRAYCFVYGIKRKKKAEMEKNMARYAALFHVGDPAYEISKFEPTKYIEGAIPRRKVPVTKEQKERAAGNTQELTKVINRRPSPVSAYHGYAAAAAAANYPFAAAAAAAHPTSQPPPLPHPAMRLYEPYTGVPPPLGAPQHDDGGPQPPPPPAAHTAADVMGVVHDTQYVPNQLLNLTNNITED